MTPGFGVVVINAHPRYTVRSQPVVQYVRRVLKKSKRRMANLSVIFIDSRSIKRMNREYLSHNYGTDVLSFCLEKKGTLEGEIYISLDKARKQAKAYKVTISNEIARLVIHGTLHLVGYDDTSRAKARSMKMQEEEHLAYWFS